MGARTIKESVAAMKAYLDNNVVSSIVKDDNESQSSALTRLLEAGEQQTIELVTSEVTLEEIRRTPKQYRAPLERTFRLLEKIPVVRWDSLLYINSYGTASTWVNCPVIQNEPLYDALLSLGLEVVDARHVFVAAKQSCDAFLTCDNTPRTGILRRAAKISALCELLVQRPSEFVANQGW
jgi:predicted nucleic acid-binding protein